MNLHFTTYIVVKNCQDETSRVQINVDQLNVSKTPECKTFPGTCRGPSSRSISIGLTSATSNVLSLIVKVIELETGIEINFAIPLTFTCCPDIQNEESHLERNIASFEFLVR